jgi:hypothetical protein
MAPTIRLCHEGPVERVSIMVAVRKTAGVKGADAPRGGQSRQSKRGRDSNEVFRDEVTR